MTIQSTAASALILASTFLISSPSQALLRSYPGAACVPVGNDVAHSEDIYYSNGNVTSQPFTSSYGWVECPIIISGSSRIAGGYVYGAGPFDCHIYAVGPTLGDPVGCLTSDSPTETANTIGSFCRAAHYVMSCSLYTPGSDMFGYILDEQP